LQDIHSHRPGAPPALHSVPTRRSSDLVDLGLGAGYRVPEFELFGADISKRYGLTDGRVRELRALWAEGRVTPAPVQPRVPIWLGDRKSTRLNSSHVSISYAVFCLKKKT